MTRRSTAAFLTVGVLLAFVPNLQAALGFPVYYLLFLYSIFFWISQATSWNILSGYSGYFSFGQATFFGMGLYGTAVLRLRYDVDFFLTIPLAGAMAGAVALLIGFVAFRLGKLRGEVFTLLTLISTFVLAAVARLSTFVDGGQGRAVPPPDYPAILGDHNGMIYRMGLVMAIGSLMAAYAIQHSKFGRGLFAIRDDEDVAEALGTPTFRYKMLIFGLTGFISGASGATHSLQVTYITIEDTFTFVVPLFVILMSTLGGRSHWMGPVLGAGVIYSLQDRLAGAGLANLSQILLGVILALVVLFVPEGLYARLRQRWPAMAVLFVTAAAVVWLVGAFGGALTRLVVAFLVSIVVAVVPRRALEAARLVRRRADPPPARSLAPDAEVEEQVVTR